VVLRQHASENETGSEKESPQKFESWYSTISGAEARFAGTSSMTDADIRRRRQY
jgi:hypothetical protein